MTETSSTHRHWPLIITEPTGYDGCVAPRDCNPGAHGDITYMEKCSCGMRRSSNVNRNYAEVGQWFTPKPTPKPRDATDTAAERIMNRHNDMISPALDGGLLVFDAEGNGGNWYANGAYGFAPDHLVIRLRHYPITLGQAKALVTEHNELMTELHELWHGRTDKPSGLVFVRDTCPLCHQDAAQ